ncbi:Predicted metalloprotease [Serratia fonticola]|uniref:Predicted metalloprotease n=1 Tax=Serratia fonticola TaxID=47917 RepID=A0A4U9UH82_SERFO|nr:Predicted metalloprotease [Serratia fonticola]
MGPFYCPADDTVYIDLSFYQDMKNQAGCGR